VQEVFGKEILQNLYKILTLVSLSVAFNSNSVIVFRTPSWTRIPWFSSDGKELSTSSTWMLKTWTIWKRLILQN